jgi:hypothetical protein
MDAPIRDKAPNQNLTTTHLGIFVIVKGQIRFNVWKKEMGSLAGIGIEVLEFNVHDLDLLCF